MVMTDNVELAVARWLQGRSRSVLREMVSVVSRPGILSLAGGLPAAELFPAEAYGRAVTRVLETDLRALQYGPPFEPLKEWIVRLMELRGVRLSTGEIFITSGAQQGIDILARVLLDEGREVAMESLTFTGIHQAVAPRNALAVTVGSDLETGMEVEELEAKLEDGARPAFVYVMPDAHNPLGVSLSTEKRRALVELAHRHSLLLVEDDPYGLLWFDGPFSPPLRALDDERTIYLGSFSKILAPGLRLGWMAAPRELHGGLALAKEAVDLESSGLTQRAVAALLEDLEIEDHLLSLRTAYRERRDAMLESLERHFPAAARWSRPQGGMFVWVELPDRIDCAALLEEAVELGVAFIPGHAFAVPTAGAGSELGRNCMRLSFSNCSPALVRKGVEQLAPLISSKLERE